MFKKFPDDPLIATALVTAVAVVVSLVATLLTLALVGHAEPPLAYVLAVCLPAVLAPLTLHPLIRARARLRRLRVEMERQARTDPLTSLPNRRAFFEQGSAMLARPQRVESPLAAMMIDVDHFKSVNALHGHAAGDEILRELAKAVRDAVAAAEATEWIVARVGGEEFAVLAEGLVPSAVGRLGERICQSARRASYSRGRPKLALTVSVGVAFRADGMNIDSLVKVADDALQVAKRSGRDRWAFAIGDGKLGDRAPPARVAVEFIRPAMR